MNTADKLRIETSDPLRAPHMLSGTLSAGAFVDQNQNYLVGRAGRTIRVRTVEGDVVAAYALLRLNALDDTDEPMYALWGTDGPDQLTRVEPDERVEINDGPRSPVQVVFESVIGGIAATYYQGDAEAGNWSLDRTATVTVRLETALDNGAARVTPTCRISFASESRLDVEAARSFAADLMRAADTARLLEAALAPFAPGIAARTERVYARRQRIAASRPTEAEIDRGPRQNDEVVGRRLWHPTQGRGTVQAVIRDSTPPAINVVFDEAPTAAVRLTFYSVSDTYPWLK